MVLVATRLAVKTRIGYLPAIFWASIIPNSIAKLGRSEVPEVADDYATVPPRHEHDNILHDIRYEYDTIKVPH